MNLFAVLSERLLDPLENKGQFIAQCEEILQSALRLPFVKQNENNLPGEVLRLCICAQLCGTSIPTIYRIYEEVKHDDEKGGYTQIPLKELYSAWNKEWKNIIESLNLQKPRPGSDSKDAVPLFSNHKVLFVPSLLFSEKGANLLLTKVRENGGDAFVCPTGEKGLITAKKIASTESSLSVIVLVCADPNIITKYGHEYDLLYRTPKWIRDCIRDLRLKDPSLYIKPGSSGSTNVCEPSSKSPLKRTATSGNVNSSLGSLSTVAKRQRASTIASTGSAGFKTIHSPDTCEKQRAGGWACEVRTSFSGTDFPMNEKICELLGVVMEACQARKEQFRAIGYQKAIAKIKALRHELTTLDDVRQLSSGRGVGDKIEAKVIEIVTTGRLRQAEAVLENTENAAVKELCQVWGVGPAKAINLTSHGITSVRDLRTAVKSDPNILDRNQRIGLKHYEDLLLRIPRKHVAELENYVKMMAKSIDQGLDITVAGSYLRGKENCGDVDILVRGSTGQLERGFPKLLDVMRKKGVLTDDLVVTDRKYFGVFQFPGRPHARVDLFAVPEHEYPFALLTYTGSAIFNRQVTSGVLKAVLVRRGTHTKLTQFFFVFFVLLSRSMRAKAKALGYSLDHRGIQRVNRGKNSKTRIVSVLAKLSLVTKVGYIPPYQLIPRLYVLCMWSH